MLKSLNREKMSKGFIVISALFTGFVIPSKFSVTTTPSLVHRVYFIRGKPDGKESLKGKYVLFHLPAQYIPARYADKKHLPVIKRVECEGGDTLKVRERSFFCNGIYLGEAKLYSLTGESLEHFISEGTIPEGEVFVMGDHKDSLDSRYFGFLETNDIRAVVLPVF